VHVHKDPPLLGTFPATLDGSLDVFIPVFALQGKADSAEDCLGVLDRRIVVPKRLVSEGISSQHSYNITKLLSAETTLVLR
jgi:hypothetical protein